MMIDRDNRRRKLDEPIPSAMGQLYEDDGLYAHDVIISCQQGLKIEIKKEDQGARSKELTLDIIIKNKLLGFPFPSSDFFSPVLSTSLRTP